MLIEHCSGRRRDIPSHDAQFNIVLNVRSNMNSVAVRNTTFDDFLVEAGKIPGCDVHLNVLQN